LGVPWSKIKSLFVVSENQASSSTMSSDDTAAIDAAIAKYAVPPEPVPALPSDVAPSQLSGTIDFQALYDQAGIPNTDEVESLEKFLVELDTELPQASKLAAAKAFLKATGKSSVDVLTDAARKIKVVRAIEASKADDSRQGLARQQSAIDDLQKQIDELRTAMEAAKRDLEAVKKQCTTEEARLQGARMFFGAMDTLADAPPPSAKK
jgi:archaellum component FlaC